MLTILQIIAERKIEEHLRQNRGTDLSHWKNKPLPAEDTSHVPPDLRIAYKLLKNAGYVPEEVELQKEITRTEDLLAHCRDEHEKLKQMKKLQYLQMKLDLRMGKKFRIDQDSPYFDKVVDKVPVNTRE